MRSLHTKRHVVDPGLIDDLIMKIYCSMKTILVIVSFYYAMLYIWICNPVLATFTFKKAAKSATLPYLLAGSS